MPLRDPAEAVAPIPHPRDEPSHHLHRPLPHAWSTAELRRAVEDGEFVLHYQPVVSLVDGGIAGVEALLRWQHPHLGVLTASEFIGSFAGSGLLDHLLPDIVHAACGTAAALSTASHRTPFVSVNVDPDQLTHDPVVDIVGSALVSTGAAPESLVIEVTERTDTFNDAGTLAVVHELS